MCFSASASFVVASGLSVVGGFSVKEALKKRIIFFAFIPFFFAFQQANEGLVWLSVDKPESIFHIFSMYAYLFFASILWPIWIPFSLYWCEENYKRKKLLLVTLLIGIFLALLYLLSWILYSQYAVVIDHHLSYPLLTSPFATTNQVVEYLEKAMAGLYLIAAVGPLFISSIKKIWIIGIIVSVSCLVIRLLMPQVFGSLWCFFAAVTSVMIYLLVSQNKA